MTDLARRDFYRDSSTSCGPPNDPALIREGKPYFDVVLDAYFGRVVGWNIDSRQRAHLVTSALGMAIDSRAARERLPQRC